MLFDHMECAVKLSHRPHQFDGDRALFLLSPEGRVREASVAGAALLGSQGALTVVDGRLTTARADEQGKLEAALNSVASAALARARPVAVTVSHPNGRRPWIVTIRPLIDEASLFPRPECELLVEVHERIPKIGSLEIVQSLFDLTDREAEVLRALADGHTLGSLAPNLGISINTVRVHLKAIFLKTGVNRQSELTQLCAGLTR